MALSDGSHFDLRRSLLERKRTCRERRDRIDPTLMIHSIGCPSRRVFTRPRPIADIGQIEIARCGRFGDGSIAALLRLSICAECHTQQLGPGADYSRFLRALFQFSKCAAREAAEFSSSRVQLLSVISAARLECGEPAAEAGELIRRQLGNSFGDFFDFHVAQYSTTEAWLSDGNGFGGRPDARLLAERVCLLRSSGYAAHDWRRVKWYGSRHIL
jgi:hypothetical protein